MAYYVAHTLTTEDKELIESLETKFGGDLKVRELIQRYAWEVYLKHYGEVNFGIKYADTPKRDLAYLTEYEKIQLLNLQRFSADEELKTLIEKYKVIRLHENYMTESYWHYSLRRCDYCGCPMDEGYCFNDVRVDDVYICTYGCALEYFDYNLPVEEEDAILSKKLEEGENAYWVQWEDCFED